MDRILRGIMRYRSVKKEQMVKQFVQVKDNPTPKAVFFTCIDSRMIPTRFTQTNVGDMFVGNYHSASPSMLAKRGQHRPPFAALLRRADHQRARGLGAGLRGQRHPPHHRLRPQRLQGHQSLAQAAGRRVRLAR
ncbi:beta carbonic anhydrase 1 isoform X3 [Tenebrio molitor]|uniref:beta carbonic anhydrase 1 isoform X3 n=1 Tax=Tenebrio molitor TaxID=7067 RepID=UPI0036249F4A